MANIGMVCTICEELMLCMELDEGMQFGTGWEVRGCTTPLHVLRPVRTPHGCGDERHVVWQTLAWFASICEELMLCMELDEGMQFGTVWEVRGCTTPLHVLRPVRTPHGCGDERHVVWQTLAWFASICEELMLCTELDEGMQFGTVWEAPSCTRPLRACWPVSTCGCR